MYWFHNNRWIEEVHHISCQVKSSSLDRVQLEKCFCLLLWYCDLFIIYTQLLKTLFFFAKNQSLHYFLHYLFNISEVHIPKHLTCFRFKLSNYALINGYVASSCNNNPSFLCVTKLIFFNNVLIISRKMEEESLKS